MMRIARTVAPVISAFSVQTERDWLKLTGGSYVAGWPTYVWMEAPMLVRLNTTIPGVGAAGETVSVSAAAALNLVVEGTGRCSRTKIQ